MTSMRLNENVTVLLREFWLNDFINSSTISQSYLNNMQTDFNRARLAGVKLILRFGYSEDDTNEDTELQQASRANIINHIIQLTPVLNQNSDVIVSIQAGFIGTYGEWYSTGNSPEFGHKDNITTEQWNNRNAVLTAMETSFPNNIPLQVRYLEILQTLRPTLATTNRIGLYNDAFLDNWCDSGTFPCSGQFGTPSQTNQNYLINLTKNLPMSGETDRFQVNNVQLPRTQCPNAAIELDKYNWSLINTEYQQDVISNWQSNGCYSDFQKRLGYRYELINSTLSDNSITINIKNTGYANIFKNRTAYLVFRNINTSQDYKLVIDTDLENWITNQATTLVTDFSNFNLPNATYKLYLELPDPSISLRDNNAYKIRTANLTTWLSTNGYNDLKQTVVINRQLSIIYVENNTIKFNNITPPVKVTIFNILGQNMKHPNLDISDLKAGYYIIKIKDKNNKIYTQKIYKD